jgi:hypothetical protein
LTVMTNDSRAQITLSFTSFLAVATLASCAHGQAATATAKTAPPMTEADAVAAQTAWCAALVGIGAEAEAGGDPAAMASKILDSAYGYQYGEVLFKPTLTHGDQTFRMDKQGALAYFIGGDAEYPDDKGFALKGWKTCTPEIKGFVASGDMGLAMGNVHLVGKDGSKVMVDKSFGYLRNADGKYIIVLHHSSLPYSPSK